MARSRKRKRADRYGVGMLTDQERDKLLYWFQTRRTLTLWISKDEVVHGSHGYDAGLGPLVRGLVTKGYLERFEVTGEPDWYPEARTRYRLTQQGRTICPNALEDQRGL